jgi:hypothetical protein
MKSPLKCHKSRFVKIWMISVWESGFWFCSLTLKIESFLNCNLLGDSLSLPCYKIKQQLISLLLLSRSLQCSKNDHFLWYSSRLRINSTNLKLPGKASILSSIARSPSMDSAWDFPSLQAKIFLCEKSLLESLSD